MTEYRGPLPQAKKLPVILTNMARRKFHDSFDFPEEPEQLLAILRNDLPEGFLSRYNKGHYRNGKNECYKLDFTNYSASIILIQDCGTYRAVSPFKRKPPLVLEGSRREIDWICTPKRKKSNSSQSY
jgi:hypothetical protein